jgi:uroporphyrinogen decarboxylase
VDAGADIIGLGDAIASLVSPRMYRRFALPYERRIFAAVREAGAIPRLHICGSTSRLVPDMLASGARIVDLDWMVDLGAAASAASAADAPALCGNFDPVRVLLNGTPDEVREAVRACAASGGARWFCMAGCEVPDGTSDANIRAIAETLCTLGTPA